MVAKYHATASTEKHFIDYSMVNIMKKHMLI